MKKQCGDLQLMHSNLFGAKRVNTDTIGELL